MMEFDLNKSHFGLQPTFDRDLWSFLAYQTTQPRGFHLMGSYDPFDLRFLTSLVSSC
jgi:hypothetical protein